jgi:pantothenate kinase
LGILRILNEFNDPSEAINGAMEGDSSEIDMSVGHIYGGNKFNQNLKSGLMSRLNLTQINLRYTLT